MTDETPTHILRRRREQKRRNFLRATGQPPRCYPHEYEEARNILLDARKAGMSTKQISEQIGVERSTVTNVIRGHKNTMHRTTYRGILDELHIDRPVKTSEHARVGALVSPLGAQRRLQALNAAGFPGTVLGELMGVDKRNLNMITLGKLHHIYAGTHTMIEDWYRKLADTDPHDYGTRPESVNRAKSGAAGRGYAPPWCWDEDTLDDPSAYPEWTGECGTETGYRIHLRENIPTCTACLAALRRNRKSGHTSGFNHIRFQMLIEASGRPYSKVAQQAGVSHTAVKYWMTGHHVPMPDKAHAFAEALGVDWRHFYDEAP